MDLQVQVTKSPVLPINQVDKLTGRQFEKYIYNCLEYYSYQCILTPASDDYGIDVIAGKSGSTIGVQCKHTHGESIGNHSVEEAFAGSHYYSLDFSIVITNGLFTPHAKQEAKRLGVYLFDRDNLSNWKAATNTHKAESQAYQYKNNSKLSGYSTVRISADDVLSLKALQLITGDKSRSNLMDKMLKIVYPVLLNSPSKQKKFHQLRNFDIKEIKLKKQMLK